MKILRRLPISTTRPICSITVFVCLLISVPVAVAAYPWDGSKEWQPAGGDCSWSNPANWPCYPIPPEGCPLPGPGDYVAVLPNQPGPCITGNATCSMLSLNPWDPTSWGGQDTVVTITETALDVNFGAALQINSQVDYDSAAGGRAIVNIYGGTVTTPNPANSTNLCGIIIGGGSSTCGNSYGIVNMYGGLVSVPRIAIYYGDVNLYGGTLECTTDPNFVLRQERTENRINVNGGALKLKGNHAAELGDYITNGRIVCIRGGTLGSPVYDGTWTTLTSTNNFNVAWGPQPANNATNIHYKDTNSITLSWQKGDLAKQHGVYFGTSFADVNSATTASPLYKGSRYDANGDPHNWTIAGPFTAGANYYWRIDETNDSNVIAKGLVWKFTTHDGKAYNPRPINGAAALSEPLQLSWTAGDFAASANGHKIYFSTNAANLDPALPNRPTDSQYRGQQTATTYSIASLRGILVLVPGATYYWCVDEVNGSTTWKGPVWSFTPATYVNIDDFEDYNSTDDVNANWPDGYTLTGCTEPWEGATGNAGRALICDVNGKHLRYTYRNGGGVMAFSEAKRPYSGGATFTGGGVISPAPMALRIDYRGYATNAAHPVYDRMYVAIEDTAGNVSVYQNPDANAQLVGDWTSWFSSLYDINAVGNTNLKAISGFAIGFGIRCNNWDFGGGDGNVMFDNIRIFTGCPMSGPLGDPDLDRNNVVDFDDLSMMLEFWLYECTPPYMCPVGQSRADLLPDCIVDLKDLAVFAAMWREEKPC